MARLAGRRRRPLEGGGDCLTFIATQRPGAAHLEEALRRRTDANDRFFAQQAERLARLCHLMAERFARGGRLLALGASPAARSDARHVAVEFVHPVIVGKRALPAIGLAGEGGELSRQLELVAREADIVIAFLGEGDDPHETARAVAFARERECLTIAYSQLGAEWTFEPPSEDGYVRQELIETLYHVLWELVHVFFDHRGLLAGRSVRRVHDAGASSFLYPFLAEHEHELEPVIENVRRSALMKAEEIGVLRAQTLTDNRDELLDAADSLRRELRRWRQAAGAGQRGLGDRCNGRRRRFPRREQREHRAAGDRPDRGLRDSDGDRQRHRDRRDLLAPGDRLWAAWRRAARDLHVGQLAQRRSMRWAKRASRALRRSRWSATTVVASGRSASPTTW